MKKTIFAVIISLIFGFGAQASQIEDFTNHNAPQDNYYQSFFDILVMDFTIPDNNGSPDELNAITMKNLGTAEDLFEIEKIKFWVDEGPEGFQGLGIDKELGTATWYALEQYWYVKNLSQEIPVGGLRFFATVETPYTFSSSSYIKMTIPNLDDKNTNGEFDLGDKGIFVASDNDGPTDEGIVNQNIQTLYKAFIDQYDPKTNITNLFNGDVIEEGEYVITGKSKDQGGSIMSYVKIIIDGEEYPVETNNNYLDWQYVANFSAGSHSIAIKHSDQVGNSGETSSITITVEASEPEPELEPESIIPGIQFGDLIKASGDSVYYYGQDGKRYVFPNEKTFKTWYDDFSLVKEITDEELASVPIGGNVVYRPGVKMVKITTDPKVYAVDQGGILRWVETPEIATSLYGENWSRMIDDVPDAFFVNYTVGNPISSSAEFKPDVIKSEVPTIAVNKGL